MRERFNSDLPSGLEAVGIQTPQNLNGSHYHFVDRFCQFKIFPSLTPERARQLDRRLDEFESTVISVVVDASKADEAAKGVIDLALKPVDMLDRAVDKSNERWHRKDQKRLQSKVRRGQQLDDTDRYWFLKRGGKFPRRRR